MVSEMLDSIGPTVLRLIVTHPLEALAVFGIIYVSLKYRDVLTYRG